MAPSSSASTASSSRYSAPRAGSTPVGRGLLVTLRSGVGELALWLSEEGYRGRLMVSGVMDQTKAFAHLGMIEGLGPVTILSKPVRLKDLRDALTRRKGGS